MASVSGPEKRGRFIGRYALHDAFASGGMATVHLGVLTGPMGFSRPVAIKRLHRHFADQADFAAMFIDEARLAARVRHPNVVPTLDVVEEGDEVCVVMEYVAGESLSRLVRTSRERGAPIPHGIVAAIFVGVLDGLQAAHDAKDERGEPLHLVHRDVSPQNVLVGTDGVARVLDFGVAKAAGRLQETQDGQLKGKIAYMSPEQLRREATAASDIFAVGICLWEALTLKRLFEADNPSVVLAKVSEAIVTPPSRHDASIPAELERVTMKALAREPGERFPSARAMARAIEACVPLAPASAVGAWVEALVGTTIQTRAKRIADIEREWSAVRSGAALGAAPAGATPSSSEPLPLEPPEPGATQLTQTANPTRITARPTSARRWRDVALGAAGAAVLVFASFAVARRWSAPATPASTEAPPLVSGASTEPTPAVPAPAAPSTSTEADTPTPPPTLSGLSVVISAPPPPTSTSKHKGAPPSHTPSRPAPPATGAAAGACSPPYTIDADGMRHYKKECF